MDILVIRRAVITQQIFRRTALEPVQDQYYSESSPFLPPTPSSFLVSLRDRGVALRRQLKLMGFLKQTKVIFGVTRKPLKC